MNAPAQHLEVTQPTEMDKIIARLPPDIALYIANLQKTGNQLIFKDAPYFSRVRFEPTITVDGSGNATYAFAQGQYVQPVSYGQGAPMNPGGFNKTGTGFVLATKADTNLIDSNGKQTNSNDIVIIEGFAIMPTPDSDPVLTAMVMGNMSVSAGFNADLNMLKYGSPLFWPGAGGLYGAQQSPNANPSINDTTGMCLGRQANGLPGAGDFNPLKDPIVWMPKGSGVGDSQFSFLLTLERAVTKVTNARTAGTGGVSPTGFTPPATDGAYGTYAEFFLHLKCAQIGPRGRTR